MADGNYNLTATPAMHSKKGRIIDVTNGPLVFRFSSGGTLLYSNVKESGSAQARDLHRAARKVAKPFVL